MRALIPATLLAVAANPAFAASGPFFSLHNTNFVVLLAFLLFVCVLIYFKVFRTVGGLLDKRAEGIQAELDEARALREEAQSLLASYERRQGEVKEMAERIIHQAREDAKLVAEQAHVDLEKSIARRLAAAEDQIASAEAAAVKDVRDKAIAVALSASRELIAKQMSASDADKLIDNAIADVGQKLH